MKTFEIEFRCLINETEFEKLNTKLKVDGKYLGPDNKDTYFFLFPDKLLKVTKNASSAKAKISLKMNRIGNGSDFEEIEIGIIPEDTEKAVKMFDMLGFDDGQSVFQFRDNYEYKGVIISIKYTESWGFHVELETLVDDISKKAAAEEQIRQVADQLGLTIMDEEHLKEFTAKIDDGWKRGEYSRSEFEQRMNE